MPEIPSGRMGWSGLWLDTAPVKGGVQISMSTRPQRDPWICGVTYSVWRQLRLGCGVVAGSRAGGSLSRGCPLLPSLSSQLAACHTGRGVPWSPTPSIAVHITGASRSDSSFDSGSSSDSPPASDTQDLFLQRGEHRCPITASRSACVLPSTPMCEGTCTIRWLSLETQFRVAVGSRDPRVPRALPILANHNNTTSRLSP